MKRTILILLTILSLQALRAQTGVTVVTDSNGDILRLIAFDGSPFNDDASAAFPAGSWQQLIRQRIERLLRDTLLQRSEVGLMVYDLTSDSVLFTHNHRKALRPASTMKLFTAVAALDRLGGDHPLTTSLYCTGPVSGQTLQGDLYCVGGMDPAFSSTDLKAMVRQLRTMGIETIQGRIVDDCSMKDTLRWGEGWCWDDENPELTPLLVDGKGGFAKRLAAELSRSGITVRGSIQQRGTLPKGARLVASCTHTLDEVLQRMMKDSDNLYAEAVFYQLAAATGHRPATARDGRTVMRQLIRRMGLNPERYRIADGSGLSLYNYLSAELHVSLLRYAWAHRRDVYDHLLPSLPVAAVDGTLKKRMHDTPAQGNVQAKTGTVTGISALAGYLTAANGHRLCFAIINQGIMQAAEGRRFQDRLCEALCQE